MPSPSSEEPAPPIFALEPSPGVISRSRCALDEGDVLRATSEDSRTCSAPWTLAVESNIASMLSLSPPLGERAAKVRRVSGGDAVVRR